MKFELSVSSLLLLSLLTGHSSVALAAQEHSPIQSSVNTELPNSQDTSLSAEDGIVNLLRVLHKVAQQDIHQVQSELILRGGNEAVNLSVKMQLETIIGQENQFHSTLTYTNVSRTSPKKYRVVSDGEKVWTYDIANNQYSVMPYEQFSQTSKDRIFIGLYTTFMMSMLESFRSDQAFSENRELWSQLMTNEAFIEEFESQLMKENFRFGVENYQGKDYSTVSISVPKDEADIKMRIDPTTAQIQDISLRGKTEEFNFAFEESVQSQPDFLNVDGSKLFTFAPPEGAKLLEEPISLQPF